MNTRIALDPSKRNTNASRQLKGTREWQDAQNAEWAARGFVPASLDLYEAAAYKRVCLETIRRACIPDREGKAALKHQRFGAAYRIAKADLDRFGLVDERASA